MSENMSEKRKREVVLGQVRSTSGNKTIAVRVPHLVKHAKYMKYVRRDSILHVHDEKNEAKVGDRVEVCQSRPMSKTKHYRLVKIVERAETA
jgi:small subunit ribosomal protein S17